MDLKLIKNVEDVIQMFKYIQYNKCDTELYVVPNVSAENVIFIQ